MSDVKPELPGGFKDYLPPEQKKREEILNTLKRIAEKYGFLPLDTPAIEKKETLTAGDENMEKQIFEIDREEEKQSIALRFDLTVPLARVMASYPNDLEKPFKRYQYGRLWRGEKPQAGRYREFTQFDVDIVGAPDVLADAEIISFMAESLESLNVPNFLIKINSRKILDQLPVVADFDKDLLKDVLRSIDKMDKIGWDGVEGELADNGLNEKQINILKEFTELSEETPQATLASVRSIFKKSGADMEGVEDMERLIDLLYDFDVSDDLWNLDLSIARGLDYYTGTVFETVIKDSDVGSIFSGGRYDNLMERFSGSPMPAVGASIGIDRLMAASVWDFDSISSDVLILNFDDSATGYCTKILKELRDGGIGSEIYNGQEETLSGQLSYGVKREFPFVIIAGSDEKEKETVQLKNIEKEEQVEVKRGDLLDKLKEVLS